MRLLGRDSRSRRGGLSRRARIAIAAAVPVVLMAVAVTAVHSPIFESDAIRVTGTSHLTQEKVVRIAGLANGTNVFFLNTGAIASRLERQPWIAQATVTRSLPSTVVIAIRERAAVGAMGDGGSYDLVAADGTVLRTAPDPG